MPSLVGSEMCIRDRLLDDQEEKKFIKLMKRATDLIVKARTMKGAETTDHYSMMGFTKAYNTAKKTCS